MKLLVVSHACVTPVNQSFFADVAEVCGFDVSLVVPNRWRTEYGPIEGVQRWPKFSGEIVQTPVILKGNIPLHIYAAFAGNIICAVQPDFVYIHHDAHALATAQFMLACNRWHKPFAFYSAQNIYKKYPMPFSALERKVFDSAGMAFPLSNTVLDVLHAKGYRRRATVLPLPVDTTVFDKDSAARARLRGELNLRADEHVIGYIGRLAPEKGVHILLQAMTLLRDLPFKLVIAGHGSAEQSLRQMVAALDLSDHVIFAGYVAHERAGQWLNAMDVLLVPSLTTATWKEQFGRVVIEAMACGVSVIGSDSGEIPVLVRATGGGIVVKEGDPPVLAEALRSLLRDAELRGRLGEMGRHHVRETFSNHALARRFGDAMLECLDA